MGMHGTVHSDKITIDPDLHLARLLGRSFGHDISREQINDLFRLHWSKLEVLAHAIHDQQIKRES